MEMKYLVEQILNSRILSPVTRHQSTALSFDKTEDNGDRFLPLFSKVRNVDKVMKILMDKYRYDMELFGYELEKRSEGFYAKCKSYQYNGRCC